MLRLSTTSAPGLVSGRSAVGRRPVVVVRAAQEAGSTRRGLLAAGLVAVGTLAASGSARARDYKEMLAKKEARRAKLKETASGIKTSGKDQQTFKSSEYEVGEEARTPNVHSRQNEGARTQENV